MIWNSHIQDLLLPIARNSILLLRPNHRILFPGNSYPFMCWTMCAMRDESNENVAGQITEGGGGGGRENPVFPFLGFRLFFPVS